MFTLSALISLASLVAGAALPRATAPSYKLKTHVLRGNHTLDGLYVLPFHTGAATNDVSLDKNGTESPVGSLTNGTYQTFVLGQYPYTFDMINAAPFSEPTVPAANVPPAGYNLVALNVGFNTPGFTVVPKVNALVWVNAQFRGFAACYVAGIAPYESVGPEVQLLWRNATAGAPSGRCADVELEAVPA